MTVLGSARPPRKLVKLDHRLRYKRQRERKMETQKRQEERARDIIERRRAYVPYRKTESVGVSNYVRNGIIEIRISDDIMQRLIAAHDRLYRVILPPYMLKAREKHLRIEFVRLADLSIPGVMLRIEQPSFDPRGNRVRHQGYQWYIRVSARRIGLRSNHLPTVVNFYETNDSNMRGLILNFDDADMLPPEESRLHRDRYGRVIERDDLRA